MSELRRLLAYSPPYTGRLHASIWRAMGTGNLCSWNWS